MNMSRVGEPRPITELDLSFPIEAWRIYDVSGEVRFDEVVDEESPVRLEAIRRHLRVGELLVVWQEGIPYVGTLQMTSTLSPLTALL